MKSNVRNGVNIGFDTDLYRHRFLGNLTLASWAFCFGTIAGVSAGEASVLTLQDAARALFEARMDEELARVGMLDALKNVDPKLFAQQMAYHVGANINGVVDVFAQYVPDGGDGFAKSLTDNPAAQLANDLIKETDEKMDWLSPILKTAALGGTVFAAAYAISRASSAFKAWFVTTSEEYFEKRKALLVSGQAVRSDIQETRERAVSAYAGLIAFERGGAQATVDTIHKDLAQDALTHLPLGDMLREIELKMHALSVKRREEREDVAFRGGDRTAVGPVQMRDIVREVIMDRSPDVVDPFVSATPGPSPT
jgi:hypothetical protein